MERQITVLLGLLDPDIEEYFTALIQDMLPGHATLKVRSVCTLPEIQQAVIEDKFDLAVLFLNNILTLNRGDVVAGLAGVQCLAARGVPVISLCGWTDRPEVAGLALAAGARFHFLAPFARQSVQVAVQQCLPSLTFCPCS